MLIVRPNRIKKQDYPQESRLIRGGKKVSGGKGVRGKKVSGGKVQEPFSLGAFFFAESEYNQRHGVRQPKDGPVIDITCPACNTIYHADETCIGLEIRCRVCGRILRVERKGIATGRLDDVVQSTVRKQKPSRGPWIGVGVILGGVILLGLLRFHPEFLEYLSNTVSTTTVGAPTSGHSTSPPTQQTGETNVPESTSPAKAKEHEIIEQDAGKLGDVELGSNYQEVNEQYYGGKLPKIPVLWEPRLEEVGPLQAEGLVVHGLWARSGDSVFILVNPEARANPSELKRVLCHEIVHEYLFTLGDTHTNHGAAFKNELHRLAEAGAFEGVAASEEEKASLKSWIDWESTRLAGESAAIREEGIELDQTKETIESEKNSSDRELRDLNQRITIANDQGSGWPSADEMESFKARGRLLNQRVADLNERVASLQARVANYNGAISRFNLSVNRYNLMMAYPDGLDEESEIQPKSTVSPQ